MLLEHQKHHSSIYNSITQQETSSMDRWHISSAIWLVWMLPFSSVSLRVAPEGRQCPSAIPLTSRSRPHHSAAVSTQKVTTAAQSDESHQMSPSSAMSSGPIDYSSPSSIEPTQDEDIEEELIANVIVHSQRSPFIRRAMFLGEDLQNLWDKVSLPVSLFQRIRISSFQWKTTRKLCGL